MLRLLIIELAAFALLAPKILRFLDFWKICGDCCIGWFYFWLII